MAWSCFPSPPNLLDLAFKIKKIKTKQKAWLADQTELNHYAFKMHRFWEKNEILSEHCAEVPVDSEQ